ncbi:cobalamin biosynthesis protein CbiX [Cupriavidus gilardii]|uniref:sirohydrochlorin chelatase n=1 Tax=Cupriavidus gilardii TaxID=82541 RepID=UPI0015744999|nr:CbiX/SirB N-terminal domain-containing protein [Cupriavidus gilardii]MCG5261466.1 CbiX/SirB N-terminal domain-containing protein [Cupriavidus gilardii]MDF9430539.1 cobalamin biosynthesis protein CbiX [Cupriavidus gilardii]NSX04570.1 CbiX/SirB N-terminal domain-containing protein [Cupriavidus gilardii]
MASSADLPSAKPNGKPSAKPGRQALVLFAHGARDARWREPFDRLHARLSARLPDCAVRLAFLELMTPDLPATLAQLAAQGIEDILVVPVFFGQGGHLRRDLPALLDDCRARLPGVRIRCAAAVGEADSVLDAIAAYCAAALAGAAADASASDSTNDSTSDSTDDSGNDPVDGPASKP